MMYCRKHYIKTDNLKGNAEDSCSFDNWRYFYVRPVRLMSVLSPASTRRSRLRGSSRER